MFWNFWYPLLFLAGPIVALIGLVRAVRFCARQPQPSGLVALASVLGAIIGAVAGLIALAMILLAADRSGDGSVILTALLFGLVAGAPLGAAAGAWLGIQLAACFRGGRTRACMSASGLAIGIIAAGPLFLFFPETLFSNFGLWARLYISVLCAVAGTLAGGALAESWVRLRSPAARSALLGGVSLIVLGILAVAFLKADIIRGHSRTSGELREAQDVKALRVRLGRLERQKGQIGYMGYQDWADAQALAELAPEEALRHRNRAARLRGAIILAQRGDTSALPVLRAEIRQPVPPGAFYPLITDAILALSNYPGGENTEVLRKVVARCGQGGDNRSHNDIEVCRAAVQVLGGMRDRCAAPLVRRLFLQEGSDRISGDVADALVRLKDEASIPIFVRVIGSRPAYSAAPQAARKALRSLGTPEALAGLAAAQAEWQRQNPDSFEQWTAKLL